MPGCPDVRGVSHSARTLLVSAQDVATEIELRREFFESRLQGPIDPDDLRDLTEMTIDDAAPIFRCECGVLLRDDHIRTPARFAGDHYGPRSLSGLHALHTDVFLKKTAIRDLAPAGSRVLEIGSYVGGFLEAARRWQWKAIGIDIGRDTARFTRELGYEVTTERFERCTFERESFDAVFIWSCFEQMTEPLAVLERVFEITKRGGWFAVTVPDGQAYVDAETAFAEGEPRLPRSHVVQRLAYNNLLGFPHRYGYGEDSLVRMITSRGFDAHSVTRVPAIRPLRERLTAAARDEEKRVPLDWIEAVFAKG